MEVLFSASSSEGHAKTVYICNHLECAMKKQLYKTPLTRVVDLVAEEFICQSGGELNGMPGYENGGDPFALSM